MKVLRKEEDLESLDTLQDGDVFVFEKKVFMKAQNNYCVSLEDGSLYMQADFSKVKKLEGKFIEDGYRDKSDDGYSPLMETYKTGF